MSKLYDYTIMFIIECIIAIIICLLFFNTKSDAGILSPRKFIYVYDQAYYDVVYDKDTLVMYSVSKGRFNEGNLTLLVDSEGKPLLYDENN